MKGTHDRTPGVSGAAERVAHSWELLLVGLAIAVHGLAISYAFFGSTELPPVSTDAAFFQHAGWYVSQGGVPYLQTFEIKPPLMIETTALLALLSGGNMFVLHLLSVLLTVIASVGSVYLAGALTYRMTDSRLAAVCAGFAILAMPAYAWLASQGVREKYFMILFGLWAVHLKLSGRPLLAGLLAALSAGFLQFGIVFAAIIAAMAVQERDPGALKRIVLGLSITTGIAVLPIMILGGFVQMIVQAVLVSFLVPEERTTDERLDRIQELLALSVYLIPVGLYGIAQSLLGGLARHWWVALGAAWFLLQVAVLDLNRWADLFALMTFLAIGVGLAVATIPVSLRWVPAVALLGLIVYGNAIEHLSYDMYRGLRAPRRIPVENAAMMRSVYWNRVIPNTCHVRFTTIARRWIALSGTSPVQRLCGGLEEVAAARSAQQARDAQGLLDNQEDATD